ncbi:MAG TPA: helix-turn-helix domain-containing protein [Actinomycetota bacterium]|nr:helix-turn-helix domain-containing protein [Actinomycetota bacterium]
MNVVPEAPRAVRAVRARRHRLLSDPTRLAIVDALSQGPKGVGELARAARVHPNTVRAHLRRLRSAGLLAEEPGPKAGPGRPPKRFRLLMPLVEEGGEYRLLVEGLLAMLRTARGDLPEALAATEGFRLGRELGRELARAESDPQEALLALLRGLSFAPVVRREEGRLVVDLRHCPFWGGLVAKAGNVICSFHFGLLRGAAEGAGGEPSSVDLQPLVRPDLCRVEVTTQPLRP